MSSPEETECELHVLPEHGLWIPPDLRSEWAHVVVRTPGVTVQHWGPFGGYYGVIGERHFGPADEFHSAANPDLCPDRVKIKHAGEDPTEFRVNIDGTESGVA